MCVYVCVGVHLREDCEGREDKKREAEREEGREREREREKEPKE